MANFDDFKQKAMDTMETIADKSVELYKAAEERTRLLAKTTKLAAEITLEKGALRRLYREIGQKYYELHKQAPETALEQSCTEVTATLGVIAAKQMEIAALKQAFEDAHRESTDDTTDIEVEIIVEEPDDDDAPAVEPTPPVTPVSQVPPSGPSETENAADGEPSAE